MNYNPYTLENKTVFVTGASSGIGRATAIECSRMGARVILTGRDKSRLQETFSSMSGHEMEHFIAVADLCNPTDLDNLLTVLPQVDGVVMCAGKGLTLPVQFCTREKFDDIFEVNFFSTVELLRLLYKKKKINKYGSVVLLSSLGGTRVFSGGNSIYGASKAALNSMMQFCAKEFAPRMIRVNSICPGMVDTPLIHRGTISDEQLEKDKERYLLKRYGCPEDIAYLSVYLLSDAASWVTGQDFIIDGGLSVK